MKNYRNFSQFVILDNEWDDFADRRQRKERDRSRRHNRRSKYDQFEMV